MAHSDASPFPTRAKPYRLPVVFRKSDGTVVTGWTGASSQICKDGTTWQSGPAPVEVPGGPGGVGFIDLDASQMDGPLIVVACSITNDTGYRAYSFVYTTDISETQGRETRLERMLSKLYYRWFNRTRMNDQKVEIFKYGTDDVIASGEITTDGSSTYRSDM